jgi:hypothetical protein
MTDRKPLCSVRPRAVLVVLAALCLLGCQAHYVMSRLPGAYTGTLGPMKRCPPGQRACADDAAYDSSKFNPANASFFALPDCPFGIQAIVVPESSSSDALVQCAGPPQQAPPQSDGGIPTMSLAPAR